VCDGFELQCRGAVIGYRQVHFFFTTPRLHSSPNLNT
jgi:hypothetical protein